MRFSERYGYKPIRQVVQIESMDSELKNGIWNVVYVRYFKGWYGRVSWQFATERHLRDLLWADYFKVPLNKAPSSPRDSLSAVSDTYAKWKWNQVYDFVEFFLERLREAELPIFAAQLNSVLEREMSAYRVVGQQIIPLTSEAQIAAIERVENFDGQFYSVSEHIRSALAKLSDRTSPDFRNSIKESVSAVEAVCRLVTGKNTLGEALKALPQAGIILHPAVKDAFSKLYGFTSDAAGIRHALMDSTTVDQQDALFMLVVCSALVDLVRSRSTTGS